MLKKPTGATHLAKTHKAKILRRSHAAVHTPTEILRERQPENISPPWRPGSSTWPPPEGYTSSLPTLFAILREVLLERQKAFTKLKNRPATNDDVFETLKRFPGVSTYDDFVDLVDCNLAKKPADMPMTRLSKFLTKM